MNIETDISLLTNFVASAHAALIFFGHGHPHKDSIKKKDHILTE